MSPALNTAISIRGGSDVQGGLMGVTRSVTTLSRIIGPAMAGLIFAFAGRNAPYIAGAIIMLFVAILAVNAIYRHRPEKSQTNT